MTTYSDSILSLRR